MPEDRPREIFEVYSDLLQSSRLVKLLRYISFLPLLLSLSLTWFGVIQEIGSWSSTVNSLFGVPIYGLYPYSIIIFGGFATVLSMKRPETGLISAIAAGTMFDLISSAEAGKHADYFSFMFWMAPIFFAFMLEKKNILRFISSRAFLVYLVFSSYMNYASLDPSYFLTDNSIRLEPMMEVVWCVCFYFAFYAESAIPPNLTESLHKLTSRMS